MKKFLQFAGLISLVLAAVGFILLMATHALTYHTAGALGEANAWYSGVAVIFGKGPASSSGSILGWGGTLNGEFEGKLAWSALLAFIFVIIAAVILLIGVVLPLLKIKALQKFAGLLNLCAVGLLVVAGIFVFVSLPAFAGANEWNSTDNWALGAGWIIGAILFILAGVVAICPTAADFMAKKKGKK